MPRRFLVIGLLALFFGSAQAAEDDGFWEVYVPGPNGLPTTPFSGQLFGFHEATNKYVPVFPSKTVAKDLYLLWTPQWFEYGWVTGDDRRRILVGSKVQANRLGFRVKSPKNWMSLEAQGTGKSPRWVKNTKRVTPEVWREDAGKGKVRSEIAPVEWVTWGGELDPPVVVEDPPTCTMTATPSPSFAGEIVRFDVETAGKATQLELFSEKLLLPRDSLEKTFPEAGTVNAVATVRSQSGLANTCRTSVVVRERTSTSGLSCTLEFEPKEASPGQTVVVTMRTSGPAEEAYLDGYSVDFPLVRRQLRREDPGHYEIEGVVLGAGSKERCRGAFVVR